jgi:hypothetical protein
MVISLGGRMVGLSGYSQGGLNYRVNLMDEAESPNNHSHGIRRPIVLLLSRQLYTTEMLREIILLAIELRILLIGDTPTQWVEQAISVVETMIGLYL